MKMEEKCKKKKNLIEGSIFYLISKSNPIAIENLKQKKKSTPQHFTI